MALDRQSKPMERTKTEEKKAEEEAGIGGEWNEK
jgi:hypothetical protein